METLTSVSETTSTISPVVTSSLFVISGPSGSGKTTLVDLLLKNQELRLERSISSTTRKPRAGEEHGNHYFFCSEEEFYAAIQEGEFIEWASVHGHLYGTPKKRVKRALEDGRHLILNIDVQGMRSFKSFMDETISRALVTCFLDVEMDELSRRLEKDRVGIHPDDLRTRLENAEGEVCIGKQEAMYVVRNHNLAEALQQLTEIVYTHLKKR